MKLFRKLEDNMNKNLCRKVVITIKRIFSEVIIPQSMLLNNVVLITKPNSK